MKDLKNNCLNCEEKLVESALYCPKCGSKAVYNNLSVKDLFKSFFDTFLNIEYRLLRSFRDIWIPNKITLNYLAGRRQEYMHPFRFFFICLVIFFTISSIYINREDNDDEYIEIERIGEHAIYTKYDSLKTNFVNDDCTQEVLDSFERKLFNKRIARMSDTLNINIGFVDFRAMGMTKGELYLESQDSLVNKYKEWQLKKKPDKEFGYIEMMFVKQTFKLQKHQVDYLKFFVKNLLWGVILLSFVVAFLMKIFYVRHNTFYAEHVIQVINYHCVFLLCFSLFMLFNVLFDLDMESLVGWLFLGLPIFFIISLKRFYSENIFKTVIKVSMIKFSYLFIILFIGLLIAAISLIFF